MSRLSVREVWKGYGGPPVLRGVTLEAEPGSLTAVLGLSGCGKTTLLRVIAGFERAERGSVTLGERTLEDGRTYVQPEKRGVGYVPQEGALFPHLTVEGNVSFGLPRPERRGQAVRQLMEMVGIAPLAARLPHELSGGEQQRVALARALALRPHALLLDEPFSSLDASLRSQVREEVHALLREQGVTTVLVTHDQEEALSLADSVAVLRDGEIIQRGSPVELYESPADELLAGFLGDVNVIEAEVRGGRAHTPLGTVPVRAGAPEGAGVVMIRPEQLEVALLSDGAPRDGMVAGRVEECRYYGHDAVLHIRPDGDGRLLLARVLGEHALPAGTAVSVHARGPAAALAGSTRTA